MAVDFSIDPAIILIMSNLALATAVLYLILLHHNETKKARQHKR